MKFKKRFTAILAALALTVVGTFSMAAAANAAGESATVGFKLDPAGSFFKQAMRPGKLTIETKITTASPKVEPMKRANLQLPASNAVTFNPGKMPVCSDADLNSNNVSVEAPQMIDRCPDSIIGNGLAKFALAQNANASLDGVILLFNGGKQATGPLKGQPRVKLYAYSYDTGVGLYAEAALAKDGSLDFAIPPLTADSSVTSINLNIPGVPTSLFVASKNLTVNLPAGQNAGYVQAKCSTGSFAFAGEFLLGSRNTAGQDSGPTSIVNDSTTYPCTGKAGKAKFGGLKIKGPKSVKRGKKGTFRVTVKNTGTATAKRVKLVVKGKGVKGKANGGKIAPGKSKTVRVKVKFTKKGKVRATFRATARSTKAKAGKRVVRVR